MCQHDPLALSFALHSAIVEGSWNPTDWGRALLRRLDGALAIPRGDADQETYRTIAAWSAASDMTVMMDGEIADGLVPDGILTTSRMIPSEGDPADGTADAATGLRLAA